MCAQYHRGQVTNAILIMTVKFSGRTVGDFRENSYFDHSLRNVEHGCHSSETFNGLARAVY